MTGVGEHPWADHQQVEGEVAEFRVVASTHTWGKRSGSRGSPGSPCPPGPTGALNWAPLHYVRMPALVLLLPPVFTLTFLCHHCPRSVWRAGLPRATSLPPSLVPWRRGLTSPPFSGPLLTLPNRTKWRAGLNSYPGSLRARQPPLHASPGVTRPREKGSGREEALGVVQVQPRLSPHPQHHHHHHQLWGCTPTRKLIWAPATACCQHLIEKTSSHTGPASSHGEK